MKYKEVEELKSGDVIRIGSKGGREHYTVATIDKWYVRVRTDKGTIFMPADSNVIVTKEAGQ